MSSNTAELTLILKAQNLADKALADIRTDLRKVAVTAGQVARDVATAFKGIGRRIGSQFGNVVQDILSGGNLQSSMATLGITMAGALAEGLMAHLIPTLLERLAATSVFAPVAAALSAGGITLGTVLTTAIGVGMAAAPFILLAAAVAALVYLIANPEARQKAKEVALMIIGRIGDGLRALVGIMGDIFKKAMMAAQQIVATALNNIILFIISVPDRIRQLIPQIPRIFRDALLAVLDIAGKIVGRIVDAILAIPRAIADALGAIGNLGSEVLQVVVGDRTPRHAEGGWVGLHGPEMGIVGEKGPEYIVPNHRLSSMGGAQPVQGVTIMGVTERQIVDMVDRGLYFRLQRSAPTAGRV